MNYETRHRVEQGVKSRVAHALNAWYINVYAQVRTLRKQDQQDQQVDWAEEKKKFLLLLLAAMLWASDELAAAEIEEWSARGRPFDLGGRTVLTQYEISAGKRLQRIADTTQQNTQLEIQRWQASDETTWTPLIERLQRWYDETRAQRIAGGETGFMLAETARAIMRMQGLHRWRWVHGDTCVTGPCLAICLPMAGRIFGMNEPMPPAASHVGCDCFPEPKE